MNVFNKDQILQKKDPQPNPPLDGSGIGAGDFVVAAVGTVVLVAGVVVVGVVVEAGVVVVVLVVGVVVGIVVAWVVV